MQQSTSKNSDSFSETVDSFDNFLPEFMTLDSSTINPTITDNNVDCRPSWFEVLLLPNHKTPKTLIDHVMGSLFNMEGYHISPDGREDEMVIPAGIYTREIAETKVAEIIEFARQGEYSLKCIMRRY